MSLPDDSGTPLHLVVAGFSAEARDVVLLELAAPDGGPLPSVEPGGHLELRLPNGLIRHYSLVSDGQAPTRYLLGIGRATDGRGGADYIHQRLRCGDPVTVTALRNSFPLDRDAAQYAFIAGGIGITPILSMIRWCRKAGRPWQLFYAARSRQRAAFVEDLSAIADDGAVRLHFDDEAGAPPDVATVLAGLPPDAQLYCCGPPPLMAAVAAATAGRPAGQVRFEWFTAPPDAADDAGRGRGFRIDLARSARSLEVPAGRSILAVLEDAGLAVPHACREGLCRTCETAVLDGVPDHRDHVLSTAERQSGRTLLVCVSRALSDSLLLDL